MVHSINIVILFDMRLAFREADLGGKFGLENSSQFVYPSMIRLGEEANRLIHKATNMNTGAEKTCTLSSRNVFVGRKATKAGMGICIN
ncbi:MAG: virulence factor SrfB [Sphingobacteriaceae bacterium]|nr:virulence factor SrfB [Sphingobacteriaceae bacterium]